MNPQRQRPLLLEGLRAFEAVARRRSFRAAAESLNLTQPAVSRQIKSLEEDLGAALFAPGTRPGDMHDAGGAFGVRALMDAQELASRTSTGTVYWEGLAELLDATGRTRIGLGYLELTGYVAPMRL